MAEEVKIAQKEPYVVELEAGTYFWCACGRSQNQPFCDNSHQGTGIMPRRLKLEEKQEVALCGCKHTGKPPFCDGQHETH
jgi:CDGSH-type Zn-finger protein